MSAARSTRRFDAAALAAVWLGATLLLRLLRELPWTLAAIAGFAAAVLAVVSLRTGRRLRAERGRYERLD